MGYAHARAFGRLRFCALAGIGALAPSVGCSDGGDGSYPFGAGAGQPATSDAQATEGGSSGQDGGSTADGGATSGTDGGANGTTMGADGTGDTDVTASGDSDTGVGTAGSDGSTSDASGPTTGGTTAATDATTGDDGMGNPGVQPGIGMYSECSMFDACAPLVDPICLSTGPVFGFCTVACNASNECDAPPGDTTTAVCDAATGYCMLDCSDGSCPIGLDCVAGDLGGGVVSRCLEQ